MGMPNSQGILHGDANFSREFCMGMANSLGNFAWNAKFPVQRGIPKTLRGSQILGGAGSSMTRVSAKSQRLIEQSW